MNELLLQKIKSLEELKRALSSAVKVTEEELSTALADLKREQSEEDLLRKLLEENVFYHNKRTHRLAEYFKEKGFLITEIGKISEISKAKYALAKHILSSMDAFRPFLRFVYERKADVYGVDSLDASVRTSLCNFCTQLEKLGWLDWTYDKKSITIQRKIPKREYSFFSGGWAEDAARYQIEKTLQDSSVKSRAVYRSVKLESFGVERLKGVHELDLIVEFADRFYVFEIKSGVTLGVERWIDHARLFDDGKGKNRFVMCCNDDSVDARLFRPYRLLHLSRIEDEFSALLQTEFKTE